MTGQAFSLKPLQSPFLIQGVGITGTLNRLGGVLSLRYELLGLSSAIEIPAPAAAPARKDGLWNATCFELFLAPRESDRYWEFNFSPAGHWNIFSFTSYRQGMREELAFSTLPFSVQIHDDALNLSADIDLREIIPGDTALNAGISAVLRSAAGDCTYWALTHCGTQPDFHRKDSFLIEC